MGKAIETIVSQESMSFEALWDGLSQKQRELLVALARDDPESVYSRAFTERWRLGASSIQATLKALESKGIVEKEKQGNYRFDDEFFRIWAAR